MSKNFTIYVAEYMQKDGDFKGKSHSYLLLMDETDPKNPKPIEELHFSPSHHDEPCIKSVVKSPIVDLSKLDLFGQICGDEQYMCAVWNVGLRLALQIDRVKIPFNSAGVAEDDNCRKGVKTVLTMQGVQMNLPDDARFIPGTAGDLFDRLIEITLPANQCQPLDEVLQDHACLVERINTCDFT